MVAVLSVRRPTIVRSERVRMAIARPTRVPSRGEVHLVALAPTRGSKIRKTRPCLVISPDELNHHLRTDRGTHDDGRSSVSVPHRMYVRWQA